MWLVDQSNTVSTPAGSHGGTIYIFDGPDLMGEAAANAAPISRIDLGGETARLCSEKTGSNPTRPHMILFSPQHTHAIVSFVASGHVVIFDAASRTPVACLQSSAGAGGARQAHAAIPAPDGSYIVVANQNGKLLERIDTNYATKSFVLNNSARIDLQTCATPSGAPCQSSPQRPDNAPICPIIDQQSRLGFITLRGGGLFVVDTKSTPMRVVAEYDSEHVHGNGCGGIQVGDRMFINSGGGTSANLYQYDLYSLSVSAYPSTPVNSPNTPVAALLYSVPEPEVTQGERDAHGMVAVGQRPYLWMFDRGSRTFDVFDAGSGAHLRNVPLSHGGVEPTPDLADIAPAGNRVFVSLRGPTPLSGDPHVSHGDLPGMAIMQVTQAGAAGEIKAIIPIHNVDAGGIERADAHGIRVRLK